MTPTGQISRASEAARFGCGAERKFHPPRRRAGWLLVFALGLILGAMPDLMATLNAAESGINPAAAQAPNFTEASRSATTAEGKKRPSLFDPEDGWLDASEFLDQAYGFIPIVMPITEPAVGYGGMGGLVFIDKQTQAGGAGFRRPNLTMVGGLGTENGTWGVLAGDVRYWLDDRLQTVVGAMYAPLNLKFYGVGNDFLNDHPLSYTITPRGGLLRGKYRLTPDSRWWAGIGYAFSSTEVELHDPGSLPPGQPSGAGTDRTAGLTPTVSFDSRDNAFTPTSGVFAEATCGVFSEALGGDSEFQRPSLVLIGYVPLLSRLTLGVRGDASASFGDVPFYMRPFVALRGVAAMRYQGQEVAQVEAELRWQFWKRFSLVGFAGFGSAWNNSDHFQNQQTVVTWGTGFRYEIARKYKLHMGLDIAFGPDDPVIYVQFGSAWMRP